MSVHFLELRRPQPDPLAAYQRARRDANLALIARLRSRPDPQDVATEIAGSIGVLEVLRQLNHLMETAQ